MIVEQIALADITADQNAQPRLTLAPEIIGEYVERMEAGDTFPPLVVFRNGKGTWLADGFHRYYAALTAKKTEFGCEVHTGGLRDAILYSCGANATHGIPRTTADKRRAVEILLGDPEWAKWSSREIATRCRVSGNFVEKVRKTAPVGTVVLDAHVSVDTPSCRTFVTKHGTEAVREVWPKRVTVPPIPEIEPRRIAALLREIEHHVDLLGNPEDVVARFPEDQWYFLPLDKIERMANFMARLRSAWLQRTRERAHAG